MTSQTNEEIIEDFDKQFNIQKGHWYPATYKRFLKRVLEGKDKQAKEIIEAYKHENDCGCNGCDKTQEVLKEILKKLNL